MAVADFGSEIVLKNIALVGSVNANKRHWYKAAQALARADRPWLERLITRRVKPDDFRNALDRKPDDIKVVIQFSEA
jgi:threonine dehydrogenase-like Zn-dependent dehydrogenase